MRHWAFAATLLSLAAGPVTDAGAAAVLKAYALSAGGNSILGAAGGGFSCATFGPDLTAGFLGSIQVGLPTDAGCGVGVDTRSATAASGTISVSSTLAVGFGTSPDLRSFTGDSTGRAGFGNLGVRASATYGGASDGFTVAGSQAFGLQREPMNIGGGVGAGRFQPTFTVDGSLFNVGNTDSQLEFYYAVDDGPAFLGFRVQNNRGSVSLYGPGGYVSQFPGMTLTGDLGTGFTESGSTTFTLDIPIVFGVSSDVTFALWASVIPRSSVGLLTGSSATVDFVNTVKLTGINVVESSTGRSLDAFTITSGSGTLYDRNGVVAVPEPGISACMLAGLLGTGLLARWRRGQGLRPVA